MTKIPSAVEKFLKEVERQTGLEIGEEGDVPLDAVIEAMESKRFFYHPKKKGFYQRQTYEDPESLAKKVPQKDVLDSVADYLETYYGKIVHEKEGEVIAREVREEIKEETKAAVPLEEKVEPPLSSEKKVVPEPEDDSLPTSVVSGEIGVPSPSRPQRGTTKVAVPPPPADEETRIKQERENRRELKRGRLALDLQNDDLNVGKKSLDNYFSYLEENPQLSLPGKGNEQLRREYINNFFQGPVQIRGRKVVLDFLDTLERIIAGPGGEAAGYFAGVSRGLYRRLPPEKVDQLIDGGMKIEEQEEKLSYFRLESIRARKKLQGLVDGELIRVNGEYALAMMKLRAEREKYSKLKEEDGRKAEEIVRLKAVIKEKEEVIAERVLNATENVQRWQGIIKRERRKMEWKTIGAAALALVVGAAAAYAYLGDKTDLPYSHSEIRNSGQ